MKYYLAIDIGASSGRHIVGYYYEGKLLTEEVYRFKNFLVEKEGHLIWDINYLFEEVKKGIGLALAKFSTIESLAIDTWGVDYALLEDDKLIEPVYAYRDSRTKANIADVHKKVSFSNLYQMTGIQFQEFNTIYQLYTDKLAGRLDKATDFLLIPEYLTYLLTGVKVHEYTNASTTGLLDIMTKNYSKSISKELGLPSHLFQTLNYPGDFIGYLKEEIRTEVGGNIKVKICCSHDTASAVEAVTLSDDSLYISSGTWSLIGIKVKKPIISREAKLANYTNEYGPDYFRFQKNIMGLWLIQRVAAQLKVDFVALINKAKNASNFQLFDVNDEAFLATNDVFKTINEWYQKNDLPKLEDEGTLINSIFHSLAYSYAVAVKEIEQITRNNYQQIVIFGGGAKNDYLNQLVKNYTNKIIIALPIEATAIGNLKIQMEVKNV